MRLDYQILLKSPSKPYWLDAPLALQTEFSLSSTFSRNLGSIPQTSAHALSISKKRTTGLIVKSFGECCGSTVLTAASYWTSSHCIPAQKFVSVSGVKSQPSTVGVVLRQGCVLSPLVFIVHELDRPIDSHSRVDEGVTVGSCRINRLLFADDLVLLASSRQGLQHALDRFSTPCDRAGMKISTKETDVLCFSRNTGQRMLQVSSNTLQ